MFPPVERANSDGLLAYGGNLRLSTLRLAYQRGIFPWPVDGYPLLWFAPPRRGILHLDEFHIPRRLARTLRQNPFEMRIDTAFPEVIRACAAARRDEEGTWITPPMIAAYIRLHRAGEAHSVEAWRDGELVGGLYGVSWGAYFCGESMFHHETDASKAAIVHLVHHLQSRGATWLDTQMLTPLFTSFGTREVPRADFMEMLGDAQRDPLKLFD